MLLAVALFRHPVHYDDFDSLHDVEAKVSKMKDGRTHLAHKAEHVVDPESGEIVAVTLHGGNECETTSLSATVIAAAEQVEQAQEHLLIALFHAHF